MSDNVEMMKANHEAFLKEHAAFIEKGNKAAGTRARKALAEMAKLAKDIRKEIQDAKNV